jgi:hypothetical protein
MTASPYNIYGIMMRPGVQRIACAKTKSPPKRGFLYAGYIPA